MSKALLEHIQENMEIIQEDPISIGVALVTIIGTIFAGKAGSAYGRQSTAMKVIFGRVFDEARRADNNILTLVGISADSAMVQHVFRQRRKFVDSLKIFAKTGSEVDLRKSRVAFVKYLYIVFNTYKDALPSEQKGLNKKIQTELVKSR